MEEENVAGAGVSTPGQQTVVPGHGLAGVDRVEKHAFDAGRGTIAACPSSDGTP